VNEFTTLALAAVQLHEWFDSLVGAGFTEAQAMQIVCSAVSGGRSE